VDVLRNAGVEVVGMTSIFNYGFDAAQEAFKNAGVDLESLTTYQSLIKLAIEKNIVSEDTEHLLQSWRTNPEEWGVDI
jgi:orotate phosphoribosyltransferase